MPPRLTGHGRAADGTSHPSPAAELPEIESYEMLTGLPGGLPAELTAPPPNTGTGTLERAKGPADSWALVRAGESVYGDRALEGAAETASSDGGAEDVLALVAGDGDEHRDSLTAETVRESEEGDRGESTWRYN